jgi:hypothetical protein
VLTFIAFDATPDTTGFNFIGEGVSFLDGHTTVHWLDRAPTTYDSFKKAEEANQQTMFVVCGSFGVLEHTDLILNFVHHPDKCATEYCTIHNRSNHSMRSFPQHWRSDRGIMERTCPHGVGHPDPDSPWPPEDPNWVHGCCGRCCN